MLKEKNIFGCNSVFYYYGIEHLLINMFQYIKDGINNNEYIYLCLTETTFNLLLTNFPDDEKKYIGNFTVSELINLHKSDDAIAVNEILRKYEKKILDNGFIGARFICESSYILKKIPKVNFIKFQKSSSRILNGLSISMMWLYDMYDYINRKAIIDDELIEISQQVSDYRLYQMKLCKIYKGDKVDSFISRT